MEARAGEKPKMIKIKYVRSAIGSNWKQRLVLRGLGLKRLNQVVEKPDRPEIRGMIVKVSHLVKVLEQ